MTLPMLLMLEGLGLAAPAPPSTPPAEIAAYYRDYNFVNAFSLLEERQLLAENLRAPGGNERLKRVKRLMRRLEAQVDQVDPGMTMPAGRLPLTALRSDLLQVASVHVDDEEEQVWVDLEVLELVPPTVAHYVSRFGELAGGGRTPSLQELTRLHRGSFRVMSRERHRWTRVDGTWRRAAATHHFIAQ